MRDRPYSLRHFYDEDNWSCLIMTGKNLSITIEYIGKRENDWCFDVSKKQNPSYKECPGPR